MPDYGLGFQVKVLKVVQVVPSWLGSGGQAAQTARPSRRQGNSDTPLSSKKEKTSKGLRTFT